MSLYRPGQWIPPDDHVALLKARYIVGDTTLAEFERSVAFCVKGSNYAAPLGALGSSLQRRLRVAVES